MLFTCTKIMILRNHLANFHQISHWSFCWNVIDSLFKWSCSIDCQAHISSSKLRTAQMMIFSLVVMIGLEKCCITSACLQWQCHSGEQTVALGPLVFSWVWYCSLVTFHKDISFNRHIQTLQFDGIIKGHQFPPSHWNTAVWWHYKRASVPTITFKHCSLLAL